jgi:hypothetical protein
MILGTLTLFSLAVIILVTLAKLYNIIEKGRLYPEIFKYFGFAGVFFAWLAILVVVNSQVHAYATNSMYSIDLYEATQYLQFANFFLLLNIFLLFVEIMYGWKGVLPRERLKVTKA